MSEPTPAPSRGPDPSGEPVRGVVVLSDVRASRGLEDREAFGEHLEAVLGRVNASCAHLVGRFVPQAGLDEFAGVIEPGHAGPVLGELWHRLHPVPVRWAVVAGSLDIVPSREDGGPPPASGFDGPAFHRAVEQLEELRSRRRLVAVRSGPGERENRLLTHLGDMVCGQMLDWTPRQMEVAVAYAGADSQQEVADELGVAQSTVSRSLSAIAFERVRPALEAFCDALDETSREPTP